MELPHTTPNVGIRHLCFALAIAGLLALSVDVPLSKAIFVDGAIENLGGDLVKTINICEFFGHTSGTLLVLIAVFALDRNGRRRLGRIAACVFFGGVAALIGKVMIIARERPQKFDFEGTVHDTFHNWIPLFTSTSMQYALDSKHLQSLPSGHSATAASLAVGLSWAYPQGRWLFALLAGLAMIQRIIGGSHYLSDTLFGAAVGGITAWVIISCPWPGHWFDKFERGKS